MFDRPKPTVGCSANGRTRRRIRRRRLNTKKMAAFLYLFLEYRIEFIFQ